MEKKLISNNKNVKGWPTRYKKNKILYPVNRKFWKIIEVCKFVTKVIYIAFKQNPSL